MYEKIYFRRILTELNDKLSSIGIKPYSANINDNVNNLMNIFKDVLDRHDPERPMSKERTTLE